MKETDPTLFLGDDLMAMLVLALGAAMLAGNLAAILRPPEKREEGDLDEAPRIRSIGMAIIGGLASIWALASLLST